MTAKYSLLALGALAASALASPSAAEAGEVMAGAACDAGAASAAPFMLRITGKLSNTSNGGVVVHCPVIKDSGTSRILSATVRVIDRNTSADFACTLATVRSDGTVLQFQTLRSTGSSPAPQSLTFGGQSAASGGAYSLECTMPAFVPGTSVSTLINYTVVEN
jgi:hypothetical protein